MSIDVMAGPGSPLRRDLAFGRTVDRSFVHRYAVNEVFVTDLVETGPETCVIAAQLPVSHSYFLDSAHTPREYGIALLAECARQACTYMAHVRFDVPLGWKFLIAGLSVRSHDSEALLVGDRPAELVISARASDAEIRGGRLRALDASLELSIGDEPVGSMTGRGRYLDAEEYEFMRESGRPGPVPMSWTLPDAPAGIAVPPAMVGRTDPRNVMLVDARRAGGGVEARLGVPGRHPTIFDHPLDHYPGMAMLEAASQAALLAHASEAGPVDAGPGRVVGIEADFAAFAELDAEVEVRARVEDGDAVRVRFTAAGDLLADLRVLVRGRR